MIYYLLMPVFSLLLLAIQIGGFDTLFFGKIAPEISLILVVYAGFFMSVMRGGTLSAFLGFFMDSMTGVEPGFFLLSYALVFLLCKMVAVKVYAGGSLFAMGFTFMCALLEKLLIVLMYKALYGMNVFSDMVTISLMQAAMTALFTPAFFALFIRLEVLLNVRKSRLPDRL
ncbi:MAG: hypothetical protein Q7J01_07175 [Syntrophales bacterium]|nr:hypothetical protein [Syntrophales bacterium]